MNLDRFLRRLVAILTLCVLATGFGCLSSITPPEHNILRFGFSLLLFFCVFILLGFLLYIFHRQLRKWSVRIGLFGVLFMFIGLHYYGEVQDHLSYSGAFAFLPSLLVAFNEALSTLFSRSSSLGRIDGPQLTSLVSQAIAGFSTVAILFSFLSRAAFNGLIGWCAHWRTHNVNVFWGLSERDILLVRSINNGEASSHGANIQINLPIGLSYDPVARARLTDLADQVNAFWRFVDYDRLDKKCHQGFRHYILSEDGHANLALANKIVEAVVKDPDACEEITLYVRAGDIDHEGVFSAWSKRVYNDTAHLVKPIVISEPEMMARRFLEEYPPVAAPCMESRIDFATGTIRNADVAPCRTLLLGFDHTGRALLNALLCQSRFVGEDGLSTIVCPVTVVDMKEIRWERYCLTSVEIGRYQKSYGLRFECLQVGYAPFEQWFRSHHREFDRVIFCLPGDQVNVREALRLRELLIELGCGFGKTHRNVELLVRVTNPVFSQYAKSRHLDQYGRNVADDFFPLKYFGDLSDVYNIDFLERGIVEQVGRWLNWQYMVNTDLSANGKQASLIHECDKEVILEQQDDKERYWEQSTFEARQSSRASAAAALSFFRLLGLECKPVANKGSKDVPVPLNVVNQMVESRKDVLARLEHLRWSTYERTLGIVKWDLKTPVSIRDIVNPVARKATNKYANQENCIKAHAALVEFDELPNVDVALAQVARPNGKWIPSMFEKQSRPRIGASGNPAASLQCKDYDVWSLLPEAMSMAGLGFFKLPGSDDLIDNENVVEALLPRESSKVIKWDDVSLKRYEELIRFANWASKVYECAKQKGGCVTSCDGKTPDEKESFLNSSLIEYHHLIKNTADGKGWELVDEIVDEKKRQTMKEIFWFDERISPRSLLSWVTLLFRRKQNKWKRRDRAKTRFAFVYDRKDASIRPFGQIGRLKKEDREKVSLRRVNLNTRSNFLARVFNWGDCAVVVFTGTVFNCLLDWQEDMTQFSGVVSPQYRLADDLVHAVCETTKQKRVILIGHSKGGGLVQYALLKNCGNLQARKIRLEGITFNSARFSKGVHDLLFRLAEKSGEGMNQINYAKEHIENYRLSGDLVSGCETFGEMDLVGSVCDIGKNHAGILDKVRHWKIAGFVVPIIAGVSGVSSHGIGRVIQALKECPPQKG